VPIEGIFDVLRLILMMNNRFIPMYQMRKQLTFFALLF